MMEFFRSCCVWVAENYKEITMTLTSAQFISLISAVVLLIKSIRSTNSNVLSSKKLESSLQTTNGISENVSVIKELNEKLKSQNESLKIEVDNLKTEIADNQETLMKKLNCMLEVQSIVYSTIKDDTIRNTVNSILTNAKYAETETRAKLKEEVANLKTQLEQEADKVKSITESATKTITKIMEPENNSTFVRY